MSIVDFVASKLLTCTIRLAEEELEHNTNTLAALEIMRKRSAELKTVSATSSEINAFSDTFGKKACGKQHNARLNHYLEVFSSIDEDFIALNEGIDSDTETVKTDCVKLEKVIGKLKVKLESLEEIEVSDDEFEKVREIVTSKLFELKAQE